ncbi:DUF975 domain-containing protein [Chroococcidiopsis sp. SAG 2025]|uniref:DUF975 domain-containing protein n=1 Tax=Chroococcidiopsis sp. SAG 2025 TaxID=171389 RepID=UPI002936FAC9|nr:DUF975 domain-containing protein [Chroococcidiopsis sp. SAG 2025]
MQPLSVGNVVTAGIRIYRSHLRAYFLLALKAYVWLLVPVYGWAKHHTINAQVSRLAFGELVSQPEAVKSAYSQIKHKLWYFLFTQIVVNILLFGTNLGISFIQALIIRFLGVTPGRETVLITLVYPLLYLIGLIIYIWVYSRFFIPELPLAIEDNIDYVKAASRSWKLTKGHVLRLQAIVLLTAIITLPLIFLSSIPLILAFGLLVAFSANATTSFNASAFLGLLLVGVILVLLASAFTTPLWQSIKAVVYYDLRTRKEGLGLKLRDRDI